MTDGLPARFHRETLDGKTCTLAASILLLRRYTERHDFTVRVYEGQVKSLIGAAPAGGDCSFSGSVASRDWAHVRVAFDDDATATNVLSACKRAIGHPVDFPVDAPDVIIATLCLGVDPDPAAAALQAELDSRQDGNGRVRFAFLFRERQGALSVRANTAARERHDVEKISNHLNVVLAALASAPEVCDEPAAAFPLVDADEMRRLRSWNDASRRPQYLPQHLRVPNALGEPSPVKDTEDTRVTTLPARIAQIAADHPNAPAVSLETGSRAWTYRELTRFASSVATRLRALLGRSDLTGERVGVYLERGPCLVASLIACHLTGAAYVPLDPLYPTDRVGGMLSDANAVAVISSAALAGAVAETVEAACRDNVTEGGFKPPSVLLVDEDEDDGDECADFGILASAAKPNNLAYVIFTSGSTGRPKGVKVTHANFMNFIYSMEETTGVDTSVVLCAVTTVCFDIAGLELFLPLCVGGRTVLASRETAADPSALSDLIAREDVNFVQATPTTWRGLIRSYGGDNGRRLDGLTALVGGESVPAELAGDMVDSTRVAFNVYGPTETTVWSTCAAITRPNLTSIGRPVANTSVYIATVVADADGKDGGKVRVEPAPVGVVGEICIGGAGVSCGYLGRDDLTAERFPRDPFSEDPDARLYRTGDLGRLRPDTLELECLGRLDHQVKIRGYRVELGEIETVLEQLPAVEQAVVVVHDSADANGEDDDKQLVAYVVDSPHTLHDADTSNEDSDLTKDLAEAEAWGAVYDEAYAVRDALDESDPSLNFSGYGNSYTPGRVHRPEVVREWVETICARIAGLQPKRALELGCGNGMILLRVAKLCERYVGTDLSANAVDYVRDVITQHPDFILPHCGLDIAGAHEATRFANERLDTVVCNGVSMYFPSADYLTSVVENSLSALEPGGHFFLGDVRNFRLLHHFHASVQLFLADPSVAYHDYRVNVATHIKHEKELLVDPVAFLAMLRRSLPSAMCDRVVIDMRRGYHRTEFGMYRYDVVFRRPRDDEDSREHGAARYELELWDPEVHSLVKIEDLLAEEAPDYLAFTGIPDARLVYEEALIDQLENAVDAHVHDTAGALRTFLDTRAAALERSAVEPEDVYRLGERLGYRVNAMWTHDKPTRFDVVFARLSAPEPEPVAFASLRCRGLDYMTTETDVVDTAEMLRELTNKGTRATARADKVLNDLLSNKKKVAGAVEKLNAPAEDVEENSAFSIVPAGKARKIRVALRSRLPAYMIPRAIVGVKSGGMPMTSNGKVDRNALPAPAELRAKGHDDDDDARIIPYVAPDGDAEELIAALFEEVLFPAGSNQVGALDDFFDLGGHSLLAMQFVGRLEAATGLRLQMRELNNAPTPRAVASALHKLGYDSTGANVSTDGRDVRSDVERGRASSLPARAASTNGLTVVNIGSLPHASMDTVGGVTRVDEIFFHTRDGTKLSARLWLPNGVSLDAGKLRAPAVIEILPYGYATATVDTDEATYPYLAGNGIACIRVDSRGSGNSEGSLDDEYSPQQQRDACDACEWAAAQPWCTGAVGMMGCSWGGFVALQVASLAGETANLPSASREAPSLRAVCAVCATDERASDDMHWMGGSLLGENLAWGAWLLDSLAAPPVPVASSVGTASPPRVFSGDTSPYDSGDEAAAGADAEADPSDGGQSSWESRWVSRLEELKPMHGDWASLHPESSKGKSYWKQGSVGSGGRSNIAVPVLSVGCLHGGGYANSTPRLARALGPNRVKAVMGSWVHNYPHLSKSGPAFGFLAEVLAFWKEHLFVPGNTTFDRDASPNANRRRVPGVRVHVQRPPLEGGPTTAPERAEGYWVAEHSQDRLDAAAEEGAFLLSFTPDGALEARTDRVNRDELDIFSHPKVMRDTPEKPVGVASGRWFTFGDGDDLPSDQHPDDEQSVCFDGSPVTVETAIIGAPRVVVACRRVGEDVETQSGVVVARICAVAPDGCSHLITYGVCNVSAMHDTRSVSSYRATEEDDSTFVVDVVCDYRAFSIPVGWKLRVALSQTYWPVIAPSPAGFEPLAIVGGACEIPALSDEHITDKWSFSIDTIPELEVLVAPLATRGLRGGEVRNHLIGAGTSAKAIRQADSGARLVQIKDSRIIVESQAVDISAKSSRSQRIERRRVIKGLDVSGRTSPKSMLDSHHVCGPASPTSRSSTSGLVDAEVVVGAEMTVVDGAYKFDTKLEAFVTEENEGSDTENRRSVFARSWTEIAPAA